jgi:glycosyltransferase involved in cell wall biosynthesis
MNGTGVSAIILTFNEEANLGDALESVVGWADAVFVVDSFSMDRTVEIALSYKERGVAVVQHGFEDYGAQWAWALARLPLRSEWVLKLDADERVTPEFKAALAVALPNADASVGGFAFRRQIEFLGRPLRFGGHLENADTRLWRRGRVRVEARTVNEHMLVDGKVGQLTATVRHCNAKDLTHWIDKHNRYSSLEAQYALAGSAASEVESRLFGSPEQRRKWFRGVHRRMPFRNSLYFLYRVVLRAGFLDGWPGVSYAFLRAAYMHWIDLKAKEARLSCRAPSVLWPQRGEPHPEVAASKLQALVDGERH